MHLQYLICSCMVMIYLVNWPLDSAALFQIICIKSRMHSCLSLIARARVRPAVCPTRNIGIDYAMCMCLALKRCLFSTWVRLRIFQIRNFRSPYKDTIKLKKQAWHNNIGLTFTIFLRLFYRNFSCLKLQPDSNFSFLDKPAPLMFFTMCVCLRTRN